MCTLSAVNTLQIRQNTSAASLVPKPSLTIRMTAISWMDRTLPTNFRTCSMDLSVNLCSVQSVTILKLTWYVVFFAVTSDEFYVSLPVSHHCCSVSLFSRSVGVSMKKSVVGGQSRGWQRLCLNFSQGPIGSHTQRCMDTGDGQILNQMADVGLWRNF